MKNIKRRAWLLGAAVVCVLLAATLLALGPSGQPEQDRQGAPNSHTFTGQVEEINDWMLAARADGGAAALHIFGTESVDTEAIGLGDTVRITYTGNIDDPGSALTASHVEKVQP